MASLVRGGAVVPMNGCGSEAGWLLEIIAGWDPREADGFAVCQHSAIRRSTIPLRIVPLVEHALRSSLLYTRPHRHCEGQLWDVISDAPMATAFACSRFLTPWLAREPWVLFCDFADMLFLADPAELLALADDSFAVMVVKRDHVPKQKTKMDNQIQTIYPRKNWSSVVLWNCAHAAHQRLTLDMVNELPGRDLHRFCWLKDAEIGNLPREWNLLVGDDVEREAKLAHFTYGIPRMSQATGPWADLWHHEQDLMDGH